MPVHRGTDILYQISVNTLNSTGNIATTQPAPGSQYAPPSAVTNTLTTALANHGSQGETLSTKQPYYTVVTGSAGTYTYYATLSSLGRTAVYLNNDTWDNEVWLLGPAVGSYPV